MSKVLPILLAGSGLAALYFGARGRYSIDVFGGLILPDLGSVSPSIQGGAVEPIGIFGKVGEVFSGLRLPRGIRNNNPGNIRHGSNWQGSLDYKKDPDFVTFISPIYGIRALGKLLINYNSFYGLNTVGGIIGRWAPPNENNTSAYVQAVAAKLGVAPDTPINVAENLARLIPAIILHENGQQPYSEAEIAQAIALI